MVHPSSAVLPADAVVGPLDDVKLLYRRAIAGWAHALLSPSPRAVWRDPLPQDDYRDRDWRRMYGGSILDD